MSEPRNFWQANLERLVRDLEAELSAGYPDWERVLLKADDLTALALAALKGARYNGEKKCRTPSKNR